MQKVKEWLDGNQNFIIGRAIYRAIISADDDLIKLLDKGFTAYAHQQLVNAMQAYLEPSVTIHASKSVDLANIEPIVFSSPSPELITKSIVDPFVLKAIDTEWQIPYKKMQHMIAQLDQFGDANDENAISYRQDLAGKILELEKKVNSIWAKKDQYKITGQLAAPVLDELVIPSDPIELAELINRTKKGIRNNRTRMKQFPDQPGYAEKYQTYKLQYFKITGKHYQDKA